MTTIEEVWAQVERFCLTGDRNGLLVAADALAELGEEEMGATLRWVVRTQRGKLPRSYIVKEGWHVGVWHKGNPWETHLREETLPDLFRRINEFRKSGMEWYK